MRKWILAVQMLLLSAIGAWAEVLTPDQALQRAAESNAANAPRMSAALKSNAAQLVFTKEAANGEPAAYIFDFNGGYMLLAADNNATTLIGYSETTQVDPDNMPDGLAYMLDEYAREIEYMRQTGQISLPRYASYTDDKRPIFPLVATKWDQDSPFNDLCPMSGSERCVTGCVATSMSQVLKYHKYPEQGLGQHTYTTGTLGVEETFDFASTTFDWENMLDVYGSSATAEQNNAVATLMKAAGVSVEMDYNVSSAGGSGATSSAIPNALVTYFGYDQNITVERRNYYELAAWEDLIYNQLANYGPVIYDGQSNTGGHSFVCDGYGGNGYFHFNWGWGGMSDGYFLLNLLDPGSQGIGGSTSGYNFNQDAVCNIKKPDGTPASPEYRFMMDNDFCFPVGIFNLGEMFASTYPAYNLSGYTIAKATTGVRIIASDSSVTYAEGYTFENIEYCSGFYVTAYLPNDLPNGAYTLEPVWKDADGEWHDILVPVDKNQAEYLDVKDGQGGFSTPAAANVTVSNQSITPVYKAQKYKYTCTLTNQTIREYYKSVFLVFLDSDNNPVAYSSRAIVDLQGRASTTLEIESTYNYATIGDLKYALAAGTPSNYSYISNKVNVHVNEQSTPSPSANSFANAYGYTSSTSTVIPGNKLKFTMNVKCNSGYFANSFTLYAIPQGESYPVASAVSNTLFLESGQSGVAEFNMDLAGEVGKAYVLDIYYGGWVGVDFWFTYGAPTTGLTLNTMMPLQFAIGEEATIKFNAVNTANEPISRTVIPVIMEHVHPPKVVMKGDPQVVTVGMNQTISAYPLTVMFKPVEGQVIEPCRLYDVTLLDAVTEEELLSIAVVTLKETNFTHSINTSHARTLYYSNYNLQLPDGVNAYVYILQGEDIEMRSLRTYYSTDIIPAGTAVMLWSDTDGDYDFKLVNGDGTIDLSNACLAGTDADQTISNAAYMHYVLGVGSKGLGWYKASADGHTVNNGAHKAYLKLPADVSSVAYIPINVEDEATGIVVVPIDDEEEEGPAFNLQGIQVDGSSYRGIIIKNGQKIYNK